MNDESLTALLQAALDPEPGRAERMHTELSARRDEAIAQRNVFAAVARSQQLVQQILTHSNPNRWATCYAA